MSFTAISSEKTAQPGIGDFYRRPMGVAVVADNEEICDRALNSIGIEWEERPFITSSAVYNAIGKWNLDFPVTPDKVLRALEKA